MIHQVANLKNQDIKSIFNTNSKSEEEEHMSHIRTLEKHYSLCIDGKKKITKIPLKIYYETHKYFIFITHSIS